jgi:hypothetical protein
MTAHVSLPPHHALSNQTRCMSIALTGIG